MYIYAIDNAYNLKCLSASKVFNEYMLSITLTQVLLLLIVLTNLGAITTIYLGC